MAKHVREPRGAKSVEHLELLRVNDPTFGTLAPRKERPNAAELPYEPLTRWNAMAKHVREPRGAKSVAHLRSLRVNDPTFGTLAPTTSMARIREWASKHAPAAGWLTFTELDDNGYVVSDNDEFLSSSTERSASPPEPEEREAYGAPPRAGSGRLPRILSTEVLSAMDDEYDALPELASSPRHQPATWRPPAPKFNPAFGFDTGRGPRRPSVDSDDGSEYSNARTERLSVERFSNDTITSFLDDTDVHSSGEWSARSQDLAAFSPLRSAERAPKMPPKAERWQLGALPAGKGKAAAPAGSSASKLPPAMDKDVPAALKPFAAGLALLKETDGDWSEA